MQRERLCVCDTVNGKRVRLVQFSLETTTLDNQIQLAVGTCVYNLKCMFYVSKLNICITSFWIRMDVDADAAKPLYALYGATKREEETKRRPTAWCAAAVGCVCKLCNDLWHTAMGALHERHTTQSTVERTFICLLRIFTSNLYLWNMNMWLTRTLNYYYEFVIKTHSQQHIANRWFGFQTKRLGVAAAFTSFWLNWIGVCRCD